MQRGEVVEVTELKSGGVRVVASPIRLSLEARHVGGAIVLHCQGRMMFAREARTLANTVSEILPIARKLVVDLAAIGDIDSAALGELVLLHLWAEAAGYSLKFAGATRAVRELFAHTNLDSVLDLHPSVPEAIGTMHHEELVTA
jgi:anti-sigma B factor antagonist